MNRRLVESFVNSIVALIPEVEDWQLTGIRSVLEKLYCSAYQEGEMRGILNEITNRNLFEHYED